MSTGKLTGKQEKFAALVAAGKSLADAYRESYNTEGSNETVCRNAVTVAAKPAVAARIEELKAETSASRRMSRDDKLRVLEGFISDSDAPHAARLRAIELHSRMCGEETPAGTLTGNHLVIAWRDGSADIADPGGA